MNKVIYVLVIAFFSMDLNAIESNKNSCEIEHLIPSGNVQIGGSLILPETKRLTSLVIMISGSGPQDRDETLDGFAVFGKLSKHFGEKGIASFRFDDRGIGNSTGHFPSTTFEDHANDVRAIIDYFKNHQKHPFNQFVLLGHSQGGIVSANVAIGNDDVGKLILIGAPSVPLIDLVLYQVRQEYADTNLSRELIESEVSSHNKLMHAIKKGENIEVALNDLKISSKFIWSHLNSDQKMDAAHIEALAENKAKEFETIYALPSLTSFLFHDTAKDYEKLDVPVLSLFGGKDLQVTIDQNKDPMEKALLRSSSPYHFKTFDDANHYFQKARTGLSKEYGTLDKKFIDGFLDSISNWLLENQSGRHETICDPKDFKKPK